MTIEEAIDGVITVREGTLEPGMNQPNFVHTVRLGVADMPMEADGLKLNGGAFIRAEAYIAVAGVNEASFRGESIAKSSEPSLLEL